MRNSMVSWMIWIYLGFSLALAYFAISTIGPALNSLTSHLVGY